MADNLSTAVGRHVDEIAHKLRMRIELTRVAPAPGGALVATYLLPDGLPKYVTMEQLNEALREAEKAISDEAGATVLFVPVKERPES